jgi:hypothetical protein
MSSTCVFQVLVLTALVFSGASAQDFLRKVSTREIINDLEASLSDLLSGHASAAASKRLATVEASIWQTFQSLPKNDMGRLAPTAVRYIVHGYFAREHGWQIKGLEPQGVQASAINANTTKVHDVNILQDKAPALVEGLLEARHQNHGLALTDVVAMCAVLEQLVFDESVTLLEAAYRLNAESVTGQLDEAGLHRVLKSYLVLFGQGSKADLNDPVRHQAILDARPREDIDDFERNAVSNFEFANRHGTNPFVARTYSFEVASQIVQDLAQRYGKWQNAECRDMKAHLVELDAEGTGRVPLGLLYAQPKSDSYHFSESPEYLRKIGALDETTSTPKVLIANYITGPSNCIASSSYYSVCCLNNCDSIMDEIEHKILAASATPARLLSAVRNITHIDALPRGLPEKLESIAERNGGEVPLHGRLFAQWLHFAFPHECNFPALVENSDVLATSTWSTATFSASQEEKMNHALAADVSNASIEIQVDDLWSDHEVLLMHEAPQMTLGSAAAAIMRTAVQLAALLVGLRTMATAWKAAVGHTEGKGRKDCKKDDDLAMGFSV